MPECSILALIYLPSYLCFDSARRDYIQWRSKPLNSIPLYTVYPHFYSEYIAILYDENLVSSIILASCKDNMISLGVVLSAAFSWISSSTTTVIAVCKQRQRVCILQTPPQILPCSFTSCHMLHVMWMWWLLLQLADEISCWNFIPAGIKFQHEISSASCNSSHHIHITCSMWQEVKLHGRICGGVCSMQTLCLCLQTAITVVVELEIQLNAALKTTPRLIILSLQLANIIEETRFSSYRIAIYSE